MPESKIDRVKILFVGGTGIISRACAELAIARGVDVTLLNRGGRAEVAGAQVIRGDIHDAATASSLREQRWDAVVDFIVFKPEEVAQRHTLFEGRTQQYIL